MSEKHTKRFSPLPEHDALLVISQKLKNRIDIAIPGNHQYNWVAGRALPVTRGAKSRHFLFSNRRYETLNILSKKGEKKISGFSLLRNADIYPFDLCYESIMEVVDEFVLAIDKNYPPNHGVGEESRQRLIEKFLDNTAYPDKVRIIDTFDFGERFCRKMSTPGRWIADTNNYLLDNCSHENCVYVMADEMYDENAFGEICKFAYQTKYSAMSHYFLHFIYDLKHIRNPQTVAYTHAIRVFKRDLYASYHDGYSFFPLIRNNDMRIIEAKYPIYHLGYVMDLRRKFGVHTSEGGIFTKSNSYGKNVFDADIVEYKGPYPKFLQNQKMSSYSKIAHLIRTIPT